MIEIRSVQTPKEIELFIDFRTELYKDDPCATPFVFMDEKQTLSKDKNPAFDFCEAEYFMAYKDGKAVGRIAAIINNKANEQWNRKSVRFGFFDFIDDEQVSRALIERVAAWGKERGMESIVGPLGFTDMDREGMLVEGFDIMASVHGNHNWPYYERHMVSMGFEKDNDWVQEIVKVPAEVPQKFAKIGALIEKRYNVHPRHLTKKQLMREGYGERFFEILNECYKSLYEFSELNKKQIEKLVHDYLFAADLDLVTFLFDNSIETDDEKLKMVGFGVSFPSFSEAMRKTGTGRLLPFGWWHLLKALRWHTSDTVDLLLIGVLPEYRAKGVNALLFTDLIPRYIDHGFKYALTLPMMETNDGVLSAWQYLDSRIAKRLRSYKRSL